VRIIYEELEILQKVSVIAFLNEDTFIEHTTETNYFSEEVERHLLSVKKPVLYKTFYRKIHFYHCHWNLDYTIEFNIDPVQICALKAATIQSCFLN